MKFILINSSGLPVYLNEGLPDQYMGPVLPGQAWSVANGGEMMISQEKQSNGLLARFHFFKLLKTIFISHLFPDKFLQTLVVMGEDIVYHVEGYGKFLLRKGEYIMVPAPGKEMKAELKAGAEYEIFEAVYTKERIEEMNGLFPLLNQLLYDENGNWIPAARETGEKAMDTIREMLHYPYSDRNIEPYYYEDHLKRLFFLLIAQSNATQGNHLMSDIEAAFKTKEEILRNIRITPAISELAKRFLLPLHRLKESFRRTFGLNPVPFIHRTRMEIAYTLVTKTNKPIKVIASELGFKKSQSFATKFKKRYGKSPMDVRNDVRNARQEIN